MNTYSHTNINLGDETEVVVRVWDNSTILELSPDFNIWLRARSRRRILEKLRNDITAHLETIPADVPEEASEPSDAVSVEIPF